MPSPGIKVILCIFTRTFLPLQAAEKDPHRDWSTGVVEWWSDGFETQYSNTSFPSRALPLDLFEQPARGFFQHPANPLVYTRSSIK
jgi:hypothetical protein